MNEVWVGNISFKTTEEDMKQLFGQIGQVISFTFRNDEAGKFQGFGFCKYKDSASVQQAIAKFNNYDFCGRNLIVSLPESAQKRQVKVEIKRKPPLNAVPNSCEQKINNFLEHMNIDQITDLLIAMKAKIEENRNEAQALLDSNPALAYALLQSQIILDLISEQEAYSMISVPAIPPNMVYMEPAIHYNPYSMGIPMIPMQSGPLAMPPYGPAVPPPPAPNQQPQHLTREQEEILKRVIQMTPEEIESLPPEMKQMVTYLRGNLDKVGYPTGHYY